MARKKRNQLSWEKSKKIAKQQRKNKPAKILYESQNCASPKDNSEDSHSQSQAQIKSKQFVQNEEIYRQLHEQLMSDRIYMREKEEKMIIQFLQGQAQTLCIVGSPGTGKTSLIKQILNQNSYNQKSIIINGLKIRNSRLKNSPLQTLLQQNESLMNPELIIIDEFDHLNKNKQILQKVQQLYPNIKLILISNTALEEIPQNIPRIYFLPYNFEQFNQICKQKLQAFGQLFSEDVIKSIAKIALTKNGDFRHITKIILKSFEISQQRENGSSVTYDDVFRSVETQNPIKEYMMSLAPQEVSLWQKILDIMKTQEILKDDDGKCSCNKFSLSFDYLCERHQQFRMNKWETGLCLKNWQQLGLVQFRKIFCQKHYIHRKILIVKNKNTIIEGLNLQRYFHLNS